MDRRVRFAMIGCGRGSGDHLDALTKGAVPAELVALCGGVPEKAQAKASKYGVPWFADFREMLARHPEIEAVCLATPTGLHAQHVLELAPSGRHVVVEKPMALSVADCRAMIAAMREGGGRL